MISSPSGAEPAAASASSSVWRRPKTTSSAIVSSGIQSTRLDGSPPSPKPAADEAAAFSTSNGALPLRRIPSRSAMRAAPAVLKAESCSVVPVASASAARSTKALARWSAGSPAIVARKSSRPASDFAPALDVHDRLDAGTRLADDQHLADEGVGAVSGHLHLDALVCLRGQGGAALRGQLIDGGLRRRPVLDLDDDDCLGCGHVAIVRPACDRDLVPSHGLIFSR